MENMDKIFENAVREGITEGVKKKFCDSYNSPLQKVMDTALETHSKAFRLLLEDAILLAVSDEEFRAEIIKETRSKLAKTLVNRFGGEIEKQVNILKSDPTTRARITIAIEDIVKKGN